MLIRLIEFLITMIRKTSTATVLTAADTATATPKNSVELILDRQSFEADGVFGTLHQDTGRVIAVTLEHAYSSNTSSSYKSKLPDGQYKCLRGIHRLGNSQTTFETFEIMNVPGHYGILFHPGNYNDDSDGCVLLGQNIVKLSAVDDTKMITHSKETFDMFMKLFENINEFTLTVT